MRPDVRTPYHPGVKAIVQDRYGSPDVLTVADVAEPLATGNRIVVRVLAASINARDWHVMRGDPYLARPTIGWKRPRVAALGTDFACRVESVGPDVTRFRPGDEVFGEADAAFAEFVMVPEDLVERKPPGLTYEQAAAIPLAGSTALMGLRDVAHVMPGQRVLINGASGGVGTFAVQLGKWLGAEVDGVCSARNADLVASLGADRVIDYAREDFTAGAPAYDVVFDLVGNRSLTHLRRALAPSGTLVLSGGGTSKAAGRGAKAGGVSFVGPMGLIIGGLASSLVVRRPRIAVLTAKPSGANLATLRDLAESGKLVPAVDRNFAFADIAEAIRYMEVEHPRAKVTITF